MGLLDGVLGGMLGGRGGGAQKVLGVVLGMVGGGGLAGLLSAFQNNGMGQQADSWVSTGQNQPVSADQVTQALGHDQLQQIADQAGISKEETSAHVAVVLPHVVDHLTPDGAVPTSDELHGAVSSIQTELAQ